MEKYCHLLHFAFLISSLLWNVKGAYYLKPTDDDALWLTADLLVTVIFNKFTCRGRFEITEIPLPSSVIEQLNQNSASVTPNPGRIHATGVHTVTAVTRISNSCQVPRPAASQQLCSTTPACSCPCPKPSLSGNSLCLRPLPPQNNNTNTWCPSVCIFLCIGGAPVSIQPPTKSKSKAAVTTHNLKVTSPLSNCSTTAVPSSTPTIAKISRSASIACPEPTVCSTSETHLSSLRTSQSRPAATLSPTLRESMLTLQKGPKEN